jgi:hypothetical protein
MKESYRKVEISLLHAEVLGIARLVNARLNGKDVDLPQNTATQAFVIKLG